MGGKWQPGQSGNPHGRPRRGDTFAELLEKELKKRKYTIKETDGTSRKVSGKQAIIRAHLAIIFAKDVSEDVRMRAIDSMYDRVDGRARQAVDMSGAVSMSNVNVYIPDNGRGDRGSNA